MRDKFYSVPATIAATLGLTDCRRSNKAGRFLLNSFDLRAYGIDKALAEGASVTTVIDFFKI